MFRSCPVFALNGLRERLWLLLTGRFSKIGRSYRALCIVLCIPPCYSEPERASEGGAEVKTRFLAGLYELSEPRTAALVISFMLAVLAVVSGLLPGGVGGGLLADPTSGGGANG